MTNDINTKIVEIYTDGACSGNPGPGGWGAVLYYGTAIKELYGSDENTTNNKMELTAAIEAFRQLKRPCIVNLYTDSTYLKDGITTWIITWKKNNWQRKGKDPIKNIDLWQTLEKVMEPHQISWHWVKAHNGNPGNEMADKLAVKGRDEAARLAALSK